ncbi:MAG: hypothetical protein DI565_02485 [Ancylobacter novellus]|uniref:Uncharacterized protein n=1 Tax=Ancylobacter novellus TaxID=921 RepID=A0A2W5KQD3_ANCNO|nr:MAG: hypothetical protein DI565_02485 [Ancylobacter novellus]
MYKGFVVANMIEGGLLQELTERLKEEQERREKLVARFQDDLRQSVETEVRLQARIDLLPRARITPAAPDLDVIKDYRGAPAIIVDLLVAAGEDGLIGSELTARLLARGVKRNTAEQAKMRLKNTHKIYLDDRRVWRLMPASAAPSESDSTEVEASRRTRTSAG